MNDDVFSVVGWREAMTACVRSIKGRKQSKDTQNNSCTSHFLIKGFITCWTLLRTYFISVFLQHVEPLFALVWLPSVFAGQAAVVVPVGEKTFFRKK